MVREQRFHSGVGWCFALGVLVVTLAFGLSLFHGFNSVRLLILGLVLTFLAWLGASTHYTVSENGLLVRSGPVRRWIEAPLVDRVRPVRTILAAPALSLRRLEISGGFGAVVVSPKDQAAFVRVLRQAMPHVRFEGDLESRTT